MADADDLWAAILREEETKQQVKVRLVALQQLWEAALDAGHPISDEVARRVHDTLKFGCELLWAMAEDEGTPQ